MINLYIYISNCIILKLDKMKSLIAYSVTLNLVKLCELSGDSKLNVGHC